MRIAARRVGNGLGRLARDRRGGTLVVLGLVLPVLAAAGGAAVEYASLVRRRAVLQRSLDTSALAGANMLKLANADDASVGNAIRTAIQNSIRTGDGRAATVAVEASTRAGTVQASIEESVPTLMGRLLSLPTATLKVRGKAKLVGATRLCMLALDAAARGALHLEKRAQLSANGCSVYANSTDAKAMQGEDNAVVAALSICSAGGFDGSRANFSPTPLTGCPSLGDPLKGVSAPSVGPCLSLSPVAGPGPGKGPGGPAAGVNTVDSVTTLDPGTYCGGLHVMANAVVTLNPGTYVIKDGPLVVDGKASMAGENVGFYFVGDAAGARFDKDTTISLTAPRTGGMAGLLMSEDPRVSSPTPPPPGPKGPAPAPPGGATKPLREYRIISNNARTMLGTIYLPVGRLVIDSDTPVADQSAYTVIVAQQVDLYDGPNLVLNANYGLTNVPVPQGVGPNGGSAVLSQ